MRGRCRRSGSSRTRCWSCPKAASKSAAHEFRWLNLCGFCLRPGFGFPGDDFRIEQARRVYAEGLRFAQPGTERDRVVDLLRPRRRWVQQESADRCFPARRGDAVTASECEAPARESRVAARDVAGGGELGIAAGADENSTGRCVGREGEEGRFRRDRPVVHRENWARGSCSTVRSTRWCHRRTRRSGRSSC